MKAATTARQGARHRQLLVIDELGGVSHHGAGELPAFLNPGDLVVANDAATLPASLRGLHVPTGEAIEVRLAGRTSLAPDAVRRFTAVLFGSGDYRTPTERRPPPPDVQAGDELRVGTLRARVLRVLGHPRLVTLEFQHPPPVVWEGIARHGRPIQYAYVPEPLAIWDTWTCLAGPPVAYEAPSAGFMLDWAMLAAIRARGARFATVTHAAGISSTGDERLDELLPFDEPYEIPPATAALMQQTQLRGGRVIAIGTTVVRALEDSAHRHGQVKPGELLATVRLGPRSRLRVVDAVVSGMHERGTSHYELLRAFQSGEALERMTVEANGHNYRAHEFGDAVFISRAAAECRKMRATA
jgi:S-adenosylmethionine:tRNA ribosyltransferase-isomerase